MLTVSVLQTKQHVLCQQRELVFEPVDGGGVNRSPRKAIPGLWYTICEKVLALFATFYTLRQ